jgi:hypothetical protein
MSYPQRISELQEQIKAAAPDSNDPARRVLADTVNRYADLRSTALEDLIELVSASTVSTTGVQERWQSRVNRARADLDRLFGDSVKDVKLSAQLQIFWFAAVQFERDFFEKLALVRTPQCIEDLLKHQSVLARMIDDLQTNWKDLLSADQSLQDDEFRPVQELDRLVQDLAQEIEAENKAIAAEAAVRLQERIKEAAARVKEEVEKKLGESATGAVQGVIAMLLAYLKDKFIGLPSEAEPEIERHKTQIQVYVDRLALFSRAYRERVAQYRSLMSIEKGGILTMFKNTRAQVAEYEKKNNLNVAQIVRDDAKRLLSEWQNAAVAGQRADAAEFDAKIFELIDRNWKVTEEMAKQFQSRFSGIFTAPLTSDTLETLTESFMFRQAIDSINGRGLGGKIDESRKLLADSISGATQMAVQPLEDMSLDWPSELKDAARLSNEQFREFVRAKLKSQIDLALNFLGEMRILLDPLKVSADFTREDLDAMLRG